MQEDHVSLAWNAARKLRTSIRNLRRVVAVELVCAARALDLRSPMTPAPATGAALARLRRRVPGPGADRWLAPELAAADACIESGDLLEAVEDAVGPLD
jgi:histidine ammonia-lyase